MRNSLINNTLNPLHLSLSVVAEFLYEYKFTRRLALKVNTIRNAVDSLHWNLIP